jgi:hypothetical protein
MKTQSDLPPGSTREPREKKKWVEPVAAVLMALATPSTATGVFFVVVGRPSGDRFKPKTS